MKKSKLQVYDPPMCCSSGVCGTNVDPELSRFANDVNWLHKQGVEVERFNLSSNPAEFVKQKEVNKILQTEGNDCLPLIVVDDLIVSKGVYPSRNQLAKFVGIENVQEAEKSAVEPESACGSGCCCGTPSSKKRGKVILGLIVLLAVGGIFAYKILNPKQNDSTGSIADKGNSSFAIAQTAPKAMPEGKPQATSVAATINAEKTEPSKDKPTAENAAASELAKGGKKIGEYLTSLRDLNKLALSQDAVFIFIPAPKSELADEKTNEAVLAAQKTLQAKNITIGLYTLQSNSPDYSSISAQVQSPAILVASKGRGMGAVSGEVTETKLLQAYIATSRAGGCGPSGCGPSSRGCN